MDALKNLASVLGRQDEGPNLALADAIAKSEDEDAVGELIINLQNASKAIQRDCIKVLYEVGGRNAALIAPHAADFLALLDNKDYGMVRGAMTALNAIASEKTNFLVSNLAVISAAANWGSVITRDWGVKILFKLAAVKEHGAKAFPLLMDQLASCPANQLPMYAEVALSLREKGQKTALAKVLANRLDGIDKDSNCKRIEKVLAKLN